MKRHILASLLLTAALIAGTSVSAPALVFNSGNAVFFDSGTPNGTLAAQADFEITGSGTMTLTLSNTAAYLAQNPPDLLAAFFFSVNGTSPTATSATASTLISDPGTGTFSVTGTNVPVSSFWAYGSGLTVYNTYNTGLGAAGFGLPWTPIDGSSSSNINGGDYSIVNGTASGQNNHIGQESPLVSNTLTVLFNVPTTVTNENLADYITGAAFQYNTSLNETVVPEPGTLLLLGGGLLGLAVYGRKRMKA